MLIEPDRLSPNEIVRALSDQDALQPLVAAVAKLPSNDQRLAEALSRAPVIMGVLGDSSGTQGLPPPRASISFAGDDPAALVNAFTGGISNLPLLSSAAWHRRCQLIPSQIFVFHWSSQSLASLSIIGAKLGRHHPIGIFVKSSEGAASRLGQRTGTDPAGR
jgi:hypothetical protein